MDMPMRHDGYLMGELLVVIMIMAFVCLLYLPKYPEVDFSDQVFINDYLYAQSEAMSSYSQEYLDNDMSSTPIYFSAMGNVNQGQTISGKHSIVIHLGNGYITYDN